MGSGDQSGLTWLAFALMTVVSWGLYGIFLHSGQTTMTDPVNGRYKAFLFVGLAYFVTAIVGPFVILIQNGTDWHFPVKGMAWSFVAGVVGAIGAFCVLLAFGAGGAPAVVMSIIFAGAPVINALVALVSHPPVGGWGSIRWQFYAGILLAALGGFMVTLYKPGPGAPPATQVKIQAPARR